MIVETVVRATGAVLWIAVLCGYIADVAPLWRSVDWGQRVVELGLGTLLAMLSYSAVRSILVDLEPSWLTVAFPLTALVMVVGQNWHRLHR